MVNRKWRFALGIFALAFLFLVMPRLARAATFTVTNNSDTGVSGDGSLRGEIIAANSAGGTNAIQFASTVTATIDLISTNGPLIVNGETLTITGPTTSPGITIDGGGQVQLMQVNSGATLNLQFLTLADGSVTGAPGATPGPGDGGAIFNGGTLTVTNSTLSANTATGGAGGDGGKGEGGAIFNGGTLTVTNSTLSANTAAGGAGGANGNGEGGAIFNQNGALLTVINSTFSDNHADGGDVAVGGAIFNDGMATVTNSTFSTNMTTVSDPDLGVNFGGAIFNDSGTETVTNSTFSDNGSLPGGAAISIFGGTVSLKGTILAGSIRGNCHGTITDASFNLADDATCFVNGVNGNIVESSTSDLGLDPMGLQMNGGPTKTIKLETSPIMSPAIGLDTDCTDQESTPQPVLTDQRHFSRPNSPSKCDSGAYEHDGVAPITGTVHGNLTITHGMTTIVDATITGNLTQTGGSLVITSSTVKGNLQITGGGTFSIDSSTIDGDFQVQNLPAGSSSDQICGSDVKGNLQVHNNGAPIVIGNASMTCAGNTIGNNLQVNNNLAALQIFDDMAGGNLQCQSNSPAPAGGGDTAKSLQGQCASF